MNCKAGVLTAIFLLLSSVTCLCASEDSSKANNLNWNFNSKTTELAITCFGNIGYDIRDNPDISLTPTELEMSEGIASIGRIDSNLKNLESVTMFNFVRNIDSRTFACCGTIRVVVIPNSVKNIGNYAFIYCTALESVTMPNSVKTIGNHAFAYCNSLESIKIPNSVKTIGSHAFFGCHKLKSIVIPDSVKTINDYAFAECYELESVVIPNTIKNIGSHAFFGCRNLKTVVIPDSIKINGDIFDSCPNITFNITYELNGGNTDNPTTYTDKGLVLKDATKEDCKFVGWFTDPKFKKRIESIPANSYGNMTLYAKFEPSNKKNNIIKRLLGGIYHRSQ